MPKAPKLERVILYSALNILPAIKISWATKLYLFFLKRWGVNFTGTPNYISSKTDIDGTDYSLLTVGRGVTISSYVRILTHDWSPHTIGKSMDIFTSKPLGHIKPVAIGDFSFVGTGSIVMPGTVIGKGCLIGAGTVVRGNIPDFSIVIGVLGTIIGDSRDYMLKSFPEFQGKISSFFETDLDYK